MDDIYKNVEAANITAVLQTDLSAAYVSTTVS